MDTNQTSLPLVSVIITCYNYEKYIDTSIQSVLSQDYPNIELIVVDDCSQDQSRVRIEQYRDQINIQFHAQNKGHAGAFNTGYSAAKGEIIMYLDADDVLLPNVMTKAVEDFPALSGMCQFRMQLIDAEDKPYDVFPKLELDFDDGLEARDKVIKMGQYQTTVTSGLMFRRQYLEQVMPIPAKEFSQGADGYLVTLAPIFTQVSSSARLLSGYRQHGENHSGFANQLTKRAKWRIQHNLHRHNALIKAAKTQDISISKSLADQDHDHLNELMCIALFEQDKKEFVTESRFNIAHNAMKTLKDKNLSFTNKAILRAWWLSIALSPKRIAQPIYSWRVLAESRPAFIKHFSRVVRRF